MPYSLRMPLDIGVPSVIFNSSSKALGHEWPEQRGKRIMHVVQADYACRTIIMLR